jgi:hypothetical protein
MLMRPSAPFRQPAQLFVGVRRRAAVFAGVEVALGRADGDLGVADAAQRGVHRGPPRRDVRHVGHQHGVGAQPVRLAFEDVLQDLRSEFLFAFDQEAKVERHPPRRFDGLEETEDLALVVGRAARIEPAVADRRLERRRGPLVEGIGRLHVIMPVDEQCRRPRHLRTNGPDDGVGLASQKLHVAAPETAQLGGDPLGGGATIGVVRGKCGDGRNTEKFFQLAQQSFTVHSGVKCTR